MTPELLVVLSRVPTRYTPLLGNVLDLGNQDGPSLNSQKVATVSS